MLTRMWTVAVQNAVLIDITYSSSNYSDPSGPWKYAGIQFSGHEEPVMTGL